jgi:hypothetical protein
MPRAGNPLLETARCVTTQLFWLSRLGDGGVSRFFFEAGQ